MPENALPPSLAILKKANSVAHTSQQLPTTSSDLHPQQQQQVEPFGSPIKTVVATPNELLMESVKNEIGGQQRDSQQQPIQQEMAVEAVVSIGSFLERTSRRF